MTLFLGLTGSIGMGKSTTAKMFRELDVPVCDSDATVHALYSGRAAPLIEAAFPGTTENGQVDRGKLSPHVVGNEATMKRLEVIVHPLVREEELKFRQQVIDSKAPLAILDIPLLFETSGEQRVDGIIVVTAPAEVQRERVLDRDSMTAEKFEAVLQRQVPDAIKREKADYVVDTSLGMDRARQEVVKIVEKVVQQQASATP